MATRPMVLGLDPGLQCTGYSVMSCEGRVMHLIEGGVLRSDPKAELTLRIADLAAGLRELMQEYRFEAVAVEQAIAHGRNFNSSLLVAQVRGALLLVISEARIPVIQFAPTHVKRQLTGSGRADKQQMQSAVQLQLKLAKQLEPHDVADASALALCLLNQMRFAA